MKKENLLMLIKRTNIFKLELTISLTPIIILAIWGWVAENVLGSQISQKYTIFFAALSTFIWGVGGLVQVVKKETSWIMGKVIRGM